MIRTFFSFFRSSFVHVHKVKCLFFFFSFSYLPKAKGFTNRMKIRRCPVGSFFSPCSWRNVKEWIKGQFSVNFLVNFVFLDLSSQVISDVFSSGSQPLKDRNERDRKKKKDVNLSWLFASACKLDSRKFLSICEIKNKRKCCCKSEILETKGNL